MTLEITNSSAAPQRENPPVGIRSTRAEDAESCGQVAVRAHQAVAAAHNSPPEHPSVEFSIGMMRFKISDVHA